MKLDGLVRVTPGFKAAVNLATDLFDQAKVSAYIPTRFAAHFVQELTAGLQESATNRVFLIHGAYGTGKSHLALTLASLVGEGWEAGWLDPVLEKLRTLDSAAEEAVRQARKALPAPLLVVPLYGSEGPTRQVLLAGLDGALRRAGLTHLMPETAFHAAIMRIEEFRHAYPDSVPDMIRAFERVGYPTIEALQSELRKYNRDALRAYEEAHPAFSRGAKADLHQGQRPEDVYQAVARQLRQLDGPRRRAGILVVWDEFGLHLESVLNDPAHRAYIDLQQFAEACSASHADRMLFLGLAHLSVEQTVQHIAGLPASQRDVLNRVAGRFLQRPVTIEPGQHYNLLARVLLPADTPRLEAFWRQHDRWVQATAARVTAAGLFSTFSTEQVEERIIRPVFPLHAAVMFLLPAISEKVAQNDRTLFHFMSDTGPDGLPAFLATEETELNGRPNLLTVDRLFPFFAPMIAASRQDEAKSIWSRYRKLPPQPNGETKSILQALLLLLIAKRPELPPTAQGLALALGLHTPEAVQVLDARLGQMYKDKLVRRWPNGSYDFRGLDGEVDLFEVLDTAMGDVPREFDIVSMLKPYAALAQVGIDIPARRHNLKHAINRLYAGDLVPLTMLKNSIYIEQGAPRERDGIAYWGLPANEHELEEALSAALKFSNPRVLVILPQSAPALANPLRKRVALNNVLKRYPQAFGEKSPQRDEWMAEIEHVETEIRSRLDGAFDKPLVFLCGKPYRCHTAEAVEELASYGMDKTFPQTMPIAHEKLVDEVGTDSYKQHRAAAITALLEQPLDHVANITSKPVAFVVNAELIKNGWLRQEDGEWVLGRPDQARHPNAAAVWDTIERYLVVQTKRYNTFLSLITDLTDPPFGLRRRTIPVLLAAVVRCHLSALSFYEGPATAALLEKAVQKPSEVHLIYAALSNEQRWVLEQFLSQLSGNTELKQKAPLRQIEGLVQQFTDRLPGFAKSTQQVSGTTRALRNEVLLPIATGNLSDSNERRLRQILFDELPRVCGLDSLKGANLSAIQGTIGTALAVAFTELRSCFADNVMPVLGEVFGVTPATTAGVREAAAAFVARAEGIPRARLTSAHRAFIEGVRKTATDPLGQIDELSKALGHKSSAEWQDEDLLAVKVAAMLYRRGLMEIRDLVEAEAEALASAPAEAHDQDQTVQTTVEGSGTEATTSGGPTVKQRQAEQPPVIQQKPGDDSQTRIAGGPHPGGSSSNNTDTGSRGSGTADIPSRTGVTMPERVGGRQPALHDVRVQVGMRTQTVKAGGSIPGKVQRTVHGINTVLNQPGLTKDEQLQAMAEVLVQLLGADPA